PGVAATATAPWTHAVPGRQRPFSAPERRDGSTSSRELGSVPMTVNRLRRWSAAAATCLAAWSVLGPVAAPAGARVVRIVIDKKESPAYAGRSFGAAGPYERITGRAFGELDPRQARNALITDLDLAPRNARGRVEYVATFSLWRPVDLSKAS